MENATKTTALDRLCNILDRDVVKFVGRKKIAEIARFWAGQGAEMGWSREYVQGEILDACWNALMCMAGMYDADPTRWGHYVETGEILPR